MQARRAIHAVRRSSLGARRMLARADAIQAARRQLALTDAEPPLVRPRDVAQRLDASSPVVRCERREAVGRVHVGRFASIAHGVEFHADDPARSERVSQFPLRARLGGGDAQTPAADITVGPEAWIGQGSIVMAGVTIGPGAFVATRSVVTRDVEAYAIVGGVPAMQTGRRFGDEQVAALLRIAWWDWPIETVKERVALLSSPNIDEFIALYDPGLTS
jgi:chloramphenicol O-acetyltransferase type B